MTTQDKIDILESFIAMIHRFSFDSPGDIIELNNANQWLAQLKEESKL